MEHVANVLSYLPTDWHYLETFDIGGQVFYRESLRFYEDLVPDNYSSAGGNNVTIYDEAKIAHRTFYKADGGAVSVFEVLEAIALYFNCTVFQTLRLANPRIELAPWSMWAQYSGTPAAFAVGRYFANGGSAGSAADVYITEEDLTHDADDQPRIAGGAFSYHRAAKEVKTTVEWNTSEPLAVYYESRQTFELSDLTDYAVGSQYAPELLGFEASTGDQLRIRCQVKHFWTGASAADIYEDITTNTAGVPDSYHIGRVRTKVRVRLVREGEQDLFLRRHLTAGGQVAVWQPWGALVAGTCPCILQT